MASRTWLERADRRRHSNRVALSAVARSIAPDDSAKAALRVLPAIPMVCGPPAQRAYVFPMFFRAVRLLFRLLLKWFHVNVSRGRARTEGACSLGIRFPWLAGGADIADEPRVTRIPKGE